MTTHVKLIHQGYFENGFYKGCKKKERGGIWSPHPSHMSDQQYEKKERKDRCVYYFDDLNEVHDLKLTGSLGCLLSKHPPFKSKGP